MIFRREGFYTSYKIDVNDTKREKECKALTFLLDNICIRFGPKLHKQIVGILRFILLCERQYVILSLVTNKLKLLKHLIPL